MNKEHNQALNALGAEAATPQKEIGNSDKKVLHCYKLDSQEWSEMSEGLFAGQRKRSMEDSSTLDEGF